jgi:hypothetical protein
VGFFILVLAIFYILDLIEEMTLGTDYLSKACWCVCCSNEYK